MASPSRDPQFVLPGVTPAVPRSRLSGLYADRIQGRCRGLSPRTVTLAAEAYEAVHGALAGCCETLGGGRSGSLWRDVVAAERPLALEWLAHLASLPQREPREAVRAVVAVLGQALETHRPAGSIEDRIVALDREAGALHALLTAALVGDGVVDADERARLAQVLDRVDSASRDARALLNGGAR